MFGKRNVRTSVVDQPITKNEPTIFYTIRGKRWHVKLRFVDQRTMTLYVGLSEEAVNFALVFANKYSLKLE